MAFVLTVDDFFALGLWFLSTETGFCIGYDGAAASFGCI